MFLFTPPVQRAEPKNTLFELPPGVLPQPKPCRASGDCGDRGDGVRKVMQAPEDSYGALLSLSLAPFHPQQRLGEAPSSSYLTLSEMSSGELLEKHLQVISDSYIRQMQASGKGGSSTTQPGGGGELSTQTSYCATIVIALDQQKIFFFI